MKISIYHIDAFADKLFTGNPAAVCVIDKWLPVAVLQSIAAENNLPATAFLLKEGKQYTTRWFAPEYEIDLCGHGSLASAFVIFHLLEPSWQQAELSSPAGLLRLRRQKEFFTLDFPAKPLEIISANDLLINGLGVVPKEVYQYKNERCLAILDSEENLKKLNPDMNILKQLAHRGIIVSSASRDYDFISRTFYPKKAISEDAVTGSSHCLLLPYWAKKLNKNVLHAFQASHRSGEILCEYQGERVFLSGKAIMYSKGEITL